MNLDKSAVLTLNCHFLYLVRLFAVVPERNRGIDTAKGQIASIL